MLEVINPATGALIRRYPKMSELSALDILERVAESHAEWRETDFPYRAERMRAAADVLRERAGEFAELMTSEMGKPIKEARSEVEKCAVSCEYYADQAERMLAPETANTEATRSYWTYRPLGIVLAVMPWNFPFWQVFRFASPNLMAGNAGVLKHASNVPGCALAIEEVFREADFPHDLFRTLLVDDSAVSGIIADGRVRAVTVTGSVAAGKAVAEKAGALREEDRARAGGK